MHHDIAVWLWVLHLLGAFYMTGLIWFVQLSHYPLMNRVPPSDYPAYQRAHMFRTTWAVGPMMLLEAGTAAGLLYVRPESVSLTVAVINLLLLLLIWVSTAALQVPCHRRLEQGFDAEVHHKLVATNWIRTVLWTVRAAILVAVTGGVAPF